MTSKAWMIRIVNDWKHVVPLEDLREHSFSWACFCQPSRVNDGEGVYLHHALDEREKDEPNECR